MGGQPDKDSNMSAIEKFDRRAEAVNSLLCVGLDADFEKLPERYKSETNPQFAFNKWIIDQTHEVAAAYKPNVAFYEARGAQGWTELKMTIEYLRENHPEIFTILDAKRADIDSTNNGYVKAIFDELGFDAVTLHPYLGSEAMKPFLERGDKVSIILGRTSNKGAGEFQDVLVNGQPLWQYVATTVRDIWNSLHNCMLVVGATYPEEMAELRALMGDMTFLVPGIGAQGGDLEKAVKAGLNSQGRGMIINSARGIIFDQNPGAAAEKLKQEINAFRG
jgi:orotidine-5'-phosphate decarboxylase